MRERGEYPRRIAQCLGRGNHVSNSVLWTTLQSLAGASEAIFHIPLTSSLMDPKDGRRRLLDLDPSGVSQEEGDESRECWSMQGEFESRVLIGLMCVGTAGGFEREVMVKRK